MNIEKLTTRGGVTKSDLSKSRKVMDGEDGATIRLQHFEQGEVTCSALFLVPAEGDGVEFICAGRAGIWMREAANDFVAARQRMAEDGEVSDSQTTCSEEIFQKAVDADFKLIATPLGMMDLVREEETCNLSITCEAWGGEGIGCPDQEDASWTVARVETLDQAEVGYLHILEEMTFERALAASALLQSLTVREQTIELEFETVAQMCDILGVTETGQSLRAEDDVPFVPADPITPEDHIAAGEDLLNSLTIDFDAMGLDEVPEIEQEPGPEAEVEFTMEGQAVFRF